MHARRRNQDILQQFRQILPNASNSGRNCVAASRMTRFLRQATRHLNIPRPRAEASSRGNFLAPGSPSKNGRFIFVKSVFWSPFWPREPRRRPFRASPELPKQRCPFSARKLVNQVARTWRHLKEFKEISTNVSRRGSDSRLGYCNWRSHR